MKTLLSAFLTLWLLALTVAVLVDRPEGAPPTAIHFGAVAPIPPPGDAGTFLGSNGNATLESWQYPLPYPYGDSGTALTSTGDGASWQSVAGGAITTLLTLDFTAQSNQVMVTDGSYTIDGLTWTKGNSSNEPSGVTSGTTTVPAVGSTVVITTSNATTFASGFYVLVSDGTNQMMAQLTAAGSTTVTAKNLGWSGYAAPTTVIATSAALSGHAVVVNGTGLVFQPASATDLNTTTRTLPYVEMTVLQLAPNVSMHTPLRAWMYNSSDTTAANYDSAVLFFETLQDVASYKTGIASKRGYYGGAAGWLVQTSFENSTSQTSVGNPITFASNKVVVLDAPGGFGGGIMFYAGAWSSGYPAAQAVYPLANGRIQAVAQGTQTLGGVGAAGLGTGDQIAVGVGAARAGSSTVLQEVIANFRFDAAANVY